MMNSTTKYILWAVGGGLTVVLIIFFVNQYRKMQAAKRLKAQEAAAEETAKAEAAAAEDEIGFVPAFSLNYGE